MIRQEDIKKIIKDRKNKIANEIELDPLTFLPSRQMEYIDLNLDRGPLMFEFISGRKNLNCEIAFSVSGAFLLEDAHGQRPSDPARYLSP